MLPTWVIYNAPKSGTPDFGVKPGNDERVELSDAKRCLGFVATTIPHSPTLMRPPLRNLYSNAPIIRINSRTRALALRWRSCACENSSSICGLVTRLAQ